MCVYTLNLATIGYTVCTHISVLYILVVILFCYCDVFLRRSPFDLAAHSFVLSLSFQLPNLLFFIEIVTDRLCVVLPLMIGWCCCCCRCCCQQSKTCSYDTLVQNDKICNTQKQHQQPAPVPPTITLAAAITATATEAHMRESARVTSRNSVSLSITHRHRPNGGARFTLCKM